MYRSRSDLRTTEFVEVVRVDTGHVCSMSPPPVPPQTPLVLVVEDEAPVGNLLRLVLDQQGCAVLLAASGEEAVEQFRARRDISFVFLDVRMAGMDGPQTLKTLQTIDPHVKCCFITGESGKYSDADLFGCGALRVIKKPFRLAEIEQVVQLWRPTSQPEERA